MTTHERAGWASIAPWVSRLILIPPILILMMISVRHISDPMHATAAVGVALTTPEALTDTRVVGGITFAIVCLLSWTLLFPSRLRIGHGLVIVLMATVLAVRFFGFAVDGTTLAMGTQKVKAGGEALFLTLNAIGYALQVFAMRRLGAER
jgi:hypothetical protein